VETGRTGRPGEAELDKDGVTVPDIAIEQGCAGLEPIELGRNLGTKTSQSGGRHGTRPYDYRDRDTGPGRDVRSTVAGLPAQKNICETKLKFDAME
jgi:hypothetical protein